MHAQQSMVDVTPRGTEGLGSLPDVLQTVHHSSPLKRRRRRSRVPLDPAFETASQEQLCSGSPPSTAHVSCQPAQRMQSAAQPQSVPSPSHWGGSEAGVEMQQCGAAQVVTSRLRWDSSTATMSDIDTAQQHSVPPSGSEGQVAAGVHGSGPQDSIDGSAAPYIPGKLSGTSLGTQNAVNISSTVNATESMPSADCNRRLEAFLQPIVADILRRKYDAH